MKKIATILVCMLALAVTFSLDAAPKKKVTKKKASTTKVAKQRPGLEMPTDRGADAAVASGYSSNKSIDELIGAAVGREGEKQPIRNLLANKDFVERAGIAPLMNPIGGLSGSAYKFNHNGTDFYMVKFSNYSVDEYTTSFAAAARTAATWRFSARRKNLTSPTPTSRSIMTLPS